MRQHATRGSCNGGAVHQCQQFTTQARASFAPEHVTMINRRTSVVGPWFRFSSIDSYQTDYPSSRLNCVGYVPRNPRLQNAKRDYLTSPKQP